MKGFVEFIKAYGVIGLAIAVIIGGKVNDLIKSIVDNIIMPFVGLILPSGDWKELVITVGNTKFGIGHVLSASLDFLIVALLVYAFAKFILKEDVVTKK
jgi:large conductance mechanosensitive channel